MAQQTQQTKYQAKSSLKKGDEVVILTGADKGKKGKIDKVDFKRNAVFVAGMNIQKKHTRPGANGEAGGILDKVASIHISNVSLADPKSGKATKVGSRVEGGKKVRFAKASGQTLA
ncbi:MAG: 50S ribosomal protein L24 [Proteobacteria bacterium]|nr:MAG: 50S ribosomal protein L24 [Pseudomonadota bacterium]